MPFPIADAIPRKKYGETSLAERLQIIRKVCGHEAGQQWKKIQMISAVPELDQKPVGRLINPLVAASASRTNGSMGEHNGR